MVRQIAISGLVLFGVLCNVSNSFAQETRTFDRIRVRLTDGRTFPGRQARLTGDSLTFRYGGENLSFARNQVVRLDQGAGNRAKSGFFVGAVVGGVVMVSRPLFRGSSSASADTGDEALERMLLGVAGGGLAGLIVGYLWPKWERVPLEPGFEATADGGAGFKLTFRF